MTVALGTRQKESHSGCSLQHGEPHHDLKEAKALLEELAS
jgi:hypothetical protein